MGLDIEGESNVEQLRRIALALQTANQHLTEALARKCRELDALKGGSGELQRMLALVEAEVKKAQETVASPPPAAPCPPKPPVRERKSTGPTPQPKLPVLEKLFELDDADRMCPSCGGELAPMVGQFEESELIDVVHLEYRLVKVKQQKYSCRCGGCVETALGPDRAMPGGRYSSRTAIR